MVQPDDGIRTQEGDILYKRSSSHRPTELSGFIRENFETRGKSDKDILTLFVCL